MCRQRSCVHPGLLACMQRAGRSVLRSGAPGRCLWRVKAPALQPMLHAQGGACRRHTEPLSALSIHDSRMHAALLGRLLYCLCSCLLRCGSRALRALHDQPRPHLCHAATDGAHSGPLAPHHPVVQPCHEPVCCGRNLRDDPFPSASQCRYIGCVGLHAAALGKPHVLWLCELRAAACRCAHLADACDTCSHAALTIDWRGADMALARMGRAARQRWRKRDAAAKDTSRMPLACV